MMLQSKHTILHIGVVADANEQIQQYGTLIRDEGWKLARIEALLRRTSQSPSEAPAIFQFGSISVDLRRTEVRREGKAVALSAKEFQLLRCFIENRGATLSREKLLQEVWGYSSTPLTRTVDVHVAWLRQKLEDDPKQPQWIVTVHGIGYRFNG
jgi:two-component system alkaline phosphatase synthesis response regulator PhoP